MPAAHSSTATAANSGGGSMPATPVSPASSAGGSSNGSAASTHAAAQAAAATQHMHAHNQQHHHHHEPHHASNANAAADDEEDDAEVDDEGAAGGGGGVAGDKKRGHGASCHQCKTTKDPQYLFFCTNKAEKGVRKRRCRKKYCDSCLKRSYQNDLFDIVPNWQCPSCLGLCICAACHRKSSKRGAPAGSPGSEVPASASAEGSPTTTTASAATSAHQPSPSPTSKRGGGGGGVKGEKATKTAGDGSSSTTATKNKRAVAAHVQMTPSTSAGGPSNEDQQHDEDQQQHDDQDDGAVEDHHAPPPSRSTHRPPIPSQLYFNHHAHHQHTPSGSSSNPLTNSAYAAFNLTSPNPLSASSLMMHNLGTPSLGSLSGMMLTPNGGLAPHGAYPSQLSTYPILDSAGSLDLESMTSAGSYRGGGISSSSNGSGNNNSSATNTPMAPAGMNNNGSVHMSFSPNPAMHGSSNPLMQFGSAAAVDQQLQHVQQQIQISQALLAQHQQHQQQQQQQQQAQAGMGYGAGPSFTVPQNNRNTSFVVDTDDDQSTVMGGVSGTGTDQRGVSEYGDEDEYSSYTHQPHRNPTLHASGLTVEQMQALRLQAHSQQGHSQQASASPISVASDLSEKHSQSELMRMAGLNERLAQQQNQNQAPPGSMSTPSRTRTISGRANAAADRLSISPLTISRGMSGTDGERPLIDSSRVSPRFSSRTLSGRGNTTNLASTASTEVPSSSSSVATTSEESASSSVAPSEAFEHLMVNMSSSQRQSFMHEAQHLQSQVKSSSSNVPSPHSGSPRSAKRKLAAAAGGGGEVSSPTSGVVNGVPSATSGAIAPVVDMSCPNQHVKYQMVARLKSQMVASGAASAAAAADSNTSSPTLASPHDRDEDVIARTKLLQNEQKQLRLQHAMEEERRRMQMLTAQQQQQNQQQRTSPSPLNQDLNLSVKVESVQQSQQSQQQQQPSASPPSASASASGLPPSHNTPTMATRRAGVAKAPLPSPVPPVVVNQHPHPSQQQQQQHGAALLFSPVFGNHGNSLALGAQSPSTMLNLIDSGSTAAPSGSTHSASNSHLFSPPAPMFHSSSLSMLPGQNLGYSSLQHASQPQPNYLQWGSAAPAPHGLMSPFGSSAFPSYPLSQSNLLPTTPAHPGAHTAPGSHAAAGGLNLFSPDGAALSCGGVGGSGGGGVAYSYPTQFMPVPVLPASHLDSSSGLMGMGMGMGIGGRGESSNALGGGGYFNGRQFSAGGQNLSMGVAGTDDPAADILHARQTSANLPMAPFVSTSST